MITTTTIIIILITIATITTAQAIAKLVKQIQKTIATQQRKAELEIKILETILETIQNNNQKNNNYTRKKLK